MLRSWNGMFQRPSHQVIFKVPSLSLSNSLKLPSTLRVGNRHSSSARRGAGVEDALHLPFQTMTLFSPMMNQRKRRRKRRRRKKNSTNRPSLLRIATRSMATSRLSLKKKRKCEKGPARPQLLQAMVGLAR